MNQARFQKQQREKARREKAAAKFARKEARATAAIDGENEPGLAMLDEETVLIQLADLHQRFEAGTIEFEDFEDAKGQLMARLLVE
jgi:hypothetical protein